MLCDDPYYMWVLWLYKLFIWLNILKYYFATFVTHYILIDVAIPSIATLSNLILTIWSAPNVSKASSRVGNPLNKPALAILDKVLKCKWYSLSCHKLVLLKET